MSLLPAWGMALVGDTPYLVVCMTAVILGMARGAGRPGRFLVAGALPLLVAELLFFWVSLGWLPSLRAERGWSMATYGQIASAIAIVRSLVRATGLALLVAAAFVDRPRA